MTQLKKQKTQTTKKINKSSSVTKTVVEHLDELKFRIFCWLAVFIAGSIVGYLKFDLLFAFITQPLNKPLFYSSPVGGFEAVLTTSLVFGFIASIPVLLYQVVRFIEPAFGSFRQRLVLVSIFFSFILSFVGISVAYYVILPSSLHFLGMFGEGQLEALITTSDYFSFVIRYLLGFALLFQLPLVLLLFNSITPLSPKTLFKYLRHVIVGSFVIAAILTPTPDFVNQVIMAAPLVLLYLISICLVWIISLRRNYTSP